MSLIKLTFFEQVSDENLIYLVDKEIAILKELISYKETDDYWHEVLILNNLFIEIKKRKLNVETEKLVEKILKVHS